MTRFLFVLVLFVFFAGCANNHQRGTAAKNGTVVSKSAASEARVAQGDEKCLKVIFDRPINEMPMYGPHTKSKAQVAADEAFFKRVAEAGLSKQQGSVKLVDIGWKYFFKGEPNTAIKRFNQAWLLDSNNGDAFHGMAVVVADRLGEVRLPQSCFNAVAGLFERALRLVRNNSGLYADYGKFLVSQGRYEASNKLLKSALFLDPDTPNARRSLATNFAELRQFDEACKWGKQALERDEGLTKLAVDTVCANAK